MESLCFASYGRAIEYGMSAPDRGLATITLFHFMFEKDYVRNHKGNKYDPQHRDFDPWWDGSGNIPNGITKHAAKNDIVADAPQYFFNDVIPELLNPDKAHYTYEELKRVIDADQIMTSERKEDLTALYEKGEWHTFLAEAFLYAIVQKNHPASGSPIAFASFDASMDQIIKLLGQYAPERINVPDIMEPDEQEYVKALLAAYADAEKVPEIKKEDLPEYKKYYRDFERQRKDYFAAESIRRSSRDILNLDDDNEYGFKAVKDEVQERVARVYNDDYDNGFEKLKAVTDKAASITLTKAFLARLVGWVGGSEQAGTCHILVNEGEFTWVDVDE